MARNKLLIYILAILLGIWLIFPIYLLVFFSVSNMSELRVVPYSLIPMKPSLNAYKLIFVQDYYSFFQQTMIEKIPFAVRNSTIIAISSVVINVVFGTFAGYAMSRFRFRGLKYFFLMMMSTKMIPPITLAIPLFLIFLRLDLLDTYFSLIMYYSAFSLPISVWILKNYFSTIPAEIEESAMVDGCSRLHAFVRVILPISTPGLVAAAVFSFLFTWNEFLIASIISRTMQTKTFPVIIGDVGLGSVGAAAAVFCLLPPLMLTLVFQKYLIKGLTAGYSK